MLGKVTSNIFPAESCWCDLLSTDTADRQTVTLPHNVNQCHYTGQSDAGPLRVNLPSERGQRGRFLPCVFMPSSKLGGAVALLFVSTLLQRGEKNQTPCYQAQRWHWCDGRPPRDSESMPWLRRNDFRVLWYLVSRLQTWYRHKIVLFSFRAIFFCFPILKIEF